MNSEVNIPSDGQFHPTGLPSGGSLPARKKVMALLVFALLLVVAVLVRSSPDLRRPLEGDELTTLKLFTGFDYDSTAQRDAAAPKVDLRRLFRGGGKAFLTPWDPNHHVLHSLAVSASQAVFGLGETACRLPAVVGSVALALAVCGLAWRWSGSLVLAALLGLAATLHPYFMGFGQTARGYSITALLLVGHVAVIEEIRRRPRAWLHFVSGGLAIAIFVNLVSTLTMWLVPLYAVLLIATRERRWWLLEATFVFSVVGTVILAELPRFIGAQLKYGVPIDSLAGLVRMDLPGYLAPGWWMPAFIVGILGCVWGALRGKWMGLVALAAFLLTLGFIVVGKKVPYPRTFVSFLIFAWIGIVQAWQFLTGRPWRWAIPLLVAAPLALALPTARAARASTTYSAAMAAITRHLATQPAGASRPLVLMPWILGEEASYYLPPDRSIVHPPKVGEPVTLFLPCEQVDGVPAFRTQYADMSKQEMVFWPAPEAWQRFSIWKQDRYTTLAVPMEAIANLPETADAPTTGVVLWESSDRYFDVKNFIADGLKTGKAPWTLKMSIIYYLQPKLLMLFFANREELDQARQILTTLGERTSGRTTCLLHRGS